MTTAIISVAQAKAWLGITDTSYDAKLAVMVAAVNEAIEGYCETSFSPVDVENELHDARRQDTLVPVNFPLIEVSAVRLNPETDGTGGETLAADAWFKRDGEILLVGRSLPQSRGYVALDYTYGYETVPARVTQAAYLGVEAMYRRDVNKAVGIGSKAKEGESISFSKGGSGWSDQYGLPMEAIGLLAEFKPMNWPSDTAMATRNR